MELWIFPCFLVLIMPAGFALLETGLCRAKNAAHAMSLNLLAYLLGITAFWAVGFALMCGGAGHSHHSAGAWGHISDISGLGNIWGFRVAGHWCGIIGGRGFFLASHLIGEQHNAMFAAFFCMMVYAIIAVAIPNGALLERWSIRSFSLFALLTGGFIFPVYGCWTWGGGWLAQLGQNFGLGNGAIDYSGSIVVHLLAGTLALTGAIQIGSRIGKYDESGVPRPIFGHHVPMVILGTFLIVFGWFGFNTARSFAANDGRAAVVAVNTALSSAAGALAAGLYMTFRYGKPDPSVTCNGMLGALVASCAGCAYVEPWAAFFIGAVGGLLAAWGVLFFERRGIDDPVGAISVHGLNGVWGAIAVGLFANGAFGAGTHHVAGPVRGLFYGNGKQLVAQLIAVGACMIWAFATGSLAFILIRAVLGTNRVPVEVEIAGLDIPEMGASGYPEFISHMAPEQVPMSEIVSARRG